MQMLKHGGMTYQQMAARLDVGISTIWRDVKAIMYPQSWRCPCCNTVHRRSAFSGMREASLAKRGEIPAPLSARGENLKS
jgi:hypothetical protein